MDQIRKRKRITVKLSCPNPLFEKWLTEWKDRAAERELKTIHSYSMALRSLQKYPLPLQTGKDCKVLRGFGDKLCRMLDEKLVEYKASGKTIEQEMNAKDLTRIAQNKVKRTKQNSREENCALNHTREYIPQSGSGPYAILLTLYEASLEPQYPGYCKKDDIIRMAQPFCNTSFTKPEPGSRYTAWSSMRTLLQKKLIQKESCPAKYSLTEEGLVLACRLHSVTSSSNDEIQPKCDNKINCIEETITSREIDILENNRFDKITIPRSEKVSPTKNLNQMKSNSKVKPKQPFSSLTSAQSSTSTTSQFSSDSTNLETIFMIPNSFDIILLVDTQETSGLKTKPLNDPIISELEKLNVRFEVRHLKVGDYAWISRQHNSNIELVLPYVLERKRMDDLGKSIKDGRFHEQKFRLKQCGVQNVIYLIEGYGNNEHTGLPLTTLYQAAANTLVQDNFTVKMTENLQDTATYLSCFTFLMNKYFKSKTLMSCSKDNLTPLVLQDDLVPLLTFKEFSRSGSKNKSLMVKDLFVRQLLQIKGMSVEKALAVIEKYPTPQHLKIAYNEKSSHESEKLLSSIQFGKLKKNVGPVLSKIIFQLYSQKTF